MSLERREKHKSPKWAIPVLVGELAVAAISIIILANSGDKISEKNIPRDPFGSDSPAPDWEKILSENQRPSVSIPTPTLFSPKDSEDKASGAWFVPADSMLIKVNVSKWAPWPSYLDFSESAESFLNVFEQLDNNAKIILDTPNATAVIFEISKDDPKVGKYLQHYSDRVELNIMSAHRVILKDGKQKIIAITMKKQENGVYAQWYANAILSKLASEQDQISAINKFAKDIAGI